MGGGNSKNEAISKIDKNQWKTIDQNNGIEIVKSNRGYGEGQIRVIPLDPKRTLDQQLEIYNYRNKQNNALVSCYGAQPLAAKSTTMCGNEQNMKVITERIPKRWSQLPQLTFPESVYGLSESLRGFQDLHSKAGPFEVSQDMIGLNNEGHIKVWSNENFAQNHPALERPVLQTTGNSETMMTGNSSQKQMVENIINVVEERCEQGRYPADFRERVLRNAVTFEDAQDEIERYSKQNNLFIPQMIHPNTNVIVTKHLQSVPVYETTQNNYKLQSGIPYENNSRQTYFEETKVIPSNVVTTTQYKKEEPVKLQTINRTTFQGQQTIPTYKYESGVPTTYQTNQTNINVEPKYKYEQINTNLPARTTKFEETSPTFKYESSNNTKNYSSVNPIIKYESTSNPITKYESTNNYLPTKTYETNKISYDNGIDFHKNPNIITTQSIYQPKTEEVTTNRYTYRTTQNVTNPIQSTEYRQTTYTPNNQYQGGYQTIATQARKSNVSFNYGVNPIVTSQVRKF